MEGKPHARDLRKGRFSEAGRIYLVTTVTRDRRPVFQDFAAARAAVDAMKWESVLGRAETLALVLMPDHLHWLLALGEGVSLSVVVRAVKAVSAHRLGRQIWQDGFHDHALRAEDDVVAVARYIVANPVRAGLVKRVGDYSHWDAVWL